VQRDADRAAGAARADDAHAPSPFALEVRVRRRLERAIESLGATALRLGIDTLARHVAGPLALAPDLRPRPFVVALSGGIRSTGHLNATTIARVRRAVDLLQSGRAETLVVSGGPRRRGRPSAAPAMRALAERLGVERRRILVEGRSSRTAENAREVARIIAPDRPLAILLVTSALHMRRAKLCFERVGFDVGPAPVDFVAGEDVARASVLTQTLHEYLGLAYYRVAGWI
jgi:uncharacterized SAM-binding protein YcdF (DUF218 family)